MIRKATYESILDEAMHLKPAERCRVAACLWDSIDSRVSLEGDELEEMLNRRESEMDENASREMSHEDFMAAFAHRRNS